MIKFKKSSIWSYILIAVTLSKWIFDYIWGPFSNIDEVLEIFLVPIIAFGLIKKRGRGLKLLAIVLMAVLVIDGLLGNVLFEYCTEYDSVAFDIVASLKGMIFFLGAMSLSYNNDNISNIIITINKSMFLLMVIMLPFAFVNLFADIGMSAETVKGIKGFRFIDSAEGNLSLIFYFATISLAAEIAIRKKITRSIFLQTMITLLLWCSTLRSRAVGFSLLFVVVIVFSLKKRQNKVKKWPLILGAFVCVAAFREKMIYYISDSHTARYNLLKYGVVLMKRFFPIGSGFATYGSDMAKKNYSRLYQEYGFDHIYGLTKDDAKFANDGTWGEIFGQFGVIGLIVFIVWILLVFFSMRNIDKKDKYFNFFVVYSNLIILLGSLGTKTYMHYSIVPCFFVMGLMVTYKKNEKILERLKKVKKNKLKHNR